MKDAHKLLQKMRNNPLDWRIENLETIARYYDINIRKSGESHVIFDHPASADMVCVPAKRPIKPIYIKRFVSLIELLEVEI